jgi:hypothetical protein
MDVVPRPRAATGTLPAPAGGRGLAVAQAVTAGMLVRGVEVMRVRRSRGRPSSRRA